MTARRPLRAALAAWREQGALDASAVAETWPLTEPDVPLWREWLDRALLALGVALLGSGVIVFFAYNWEAMHRFARFGLLAAAITALAGFALARPAGDRWALAALSGGQIATGALLAVIGQAYQSGADVWQLFALWAALAVPWALAARTDAAWWPVIVLANVALLRWFEIVLGLEGLFTLAFGAGRVRAVLAVLLAVAVLQLALWFALRARAPSWGFRGLGGARMLAALVCAYAAWMGVAAVIDGSGGLDAGAALPLAVALAVLAALGWWFRGSHFDVLVLSLACLAAIVIANAAIGRFVFSGHRETGGFLLLGLLTIAFAALAARWLLDAWRNQRREAT